MEYLSTFSETLSMQKLSTSSYNLEIQTTCGQGFTDQQGNWTMDDPSKIPVSGDWLHLGNSGTIQKPRRRKEKLDGRMWASLLRTIRLLFVNYMSCSGTTSLWRKITVCCVKWQCKKNTKNLTNLFLTWCLKYILSLQGIVWIIHDVTPGLVAWFYNETETILTIHWLYLFSWNLWIIEAYQEQPHSHSAPDQANKSYLYQI